MTHPYSPRDLPIVKLMSAPAALIVVDMQKDFIEAGRPLPADGGLKIIPNVNRLISVARSQSWPVIFTHETHRPDLSDYGIELEFDPRHCEETTDGPELADGIAAIEADRHIWSKRRYDAFFGTELDTLLRSLGVKNLFVCGVDTDICVLSTVCTARNLDYRVVVVSDCCAGSTERAHQAGLICLGTSFAYIACLDEVESHFANSTNPSGKMAA